MHPNSKSRRRHSTELKAKVLAACAEPGASISGVALAHGLNANLVRKWRSGRGTKRDSMPATSATSGAVTPAPSGAAAEFVAVEMPAPSKAVSRTAVAPREPAPIAEPLILVELRRGALHLNVRWPTAAAEDCRSWLRELSSSLLK
ncbi:IS66-like element accessory protein TnpA [Aquabacterium sp. OR-4]|uniref:IS66-like element accessory protein TnpA n=1 Tax=Aquabacterium sp. OR-4 TaxID=2978127 RepID=UPI0028C9FCEE|nr:transposase [Aquabacterium sp. OR-4]MDT7836913.1 transposase [Aquabacterium sp. OR-4]